MIYNDIKNKNNILFNQNSIIANVVFLNILLKKYLKMNYKITSFYY